MRFLFNFIFFIALDIYAFQAIRTSIQNWSFNYRILAYILYWIIPAALFSILLYSNINEQVKTQNWYIYLRASFFIIYLTKFFIALFLIIDDLRRLYLWISDRWNENADKDRSRSKFLSQLGLLVGSIPFTSLTYGMIRNPYRYTVFREKVNMPNLPAGLNGLRIVQISDIHSGSFTFKDPVSRSVELINESNPDLVFFTGDLVNSVATEVEDYIEIFGKIKAKYGVFSVLGNHDYGDYHRWPNAAAKQENLERLKQAHATMGWRLLINENELIDVNGNQVAVIGVENYSVVMHFPRYGDLAKAYKGAEKAPLKLLLSHDPSHWDAQITTEFSDIDITFSGHTHGMQFGIEIPGWIKFSPIQFIYKQWAGLYQKGKQYLYVNRGLGFVGYPGRVGILPEITILDIETT